MDSRMPCTAARAVRPRDKARPVVRRARNARVTRLSSLRYCLDRARSDLRGSLAAGSLSGDGELQAYTVAAWRKSSKLALTVYAVPRCKTKVGPVKKMVATVS